MTVRHMKIYLEVYRCGSITHAAENLHMTQPAVTRTIQELERYYGIHLFDRINRRLMVTEAGQEFYSQAVHIVDMFDRMEKRLRNWDALGVLRIGSGVTVGNDALPDLILRFRKFHPGLRTQVSVCNGQTLEQALLHNELDLALTEGKLSHPDLLSRPFSTEHMVLIVPPEHPLLLQDCVHLEDLVSYDLLMREKGCAGRAYLDSVFAVHSLSVQPLWESVSTQALIRAVGKGLGISLLPWSLVQEDVERGTVCTCPIADEAFLRQNYIVWHKHKYLTQAAQDFIALCEADGTPESTSPTT